MTVRGAPSVRRILKPTWSPSISQSYGRNLLPSFSQVQVLRDRDALRFRHSVLSSAHSPLLRRHCSLHHSPLDVSTSLMASASKNASDHYRLPTEVRPRHYDLTIRTDLEKEKFTGFVKIECVLRLNHIVDHCALARLPQPRDRESDQGRHLQCRRRACARSSDPCPCVLGHAHCTCRD